MRFRIGVAFAAALGVLCWIGSRQPLAAQPPSTPWGIRLPPLEAPYPLPELPHRSPRNANYTIEARLDPEGHTIDGRLVLEWRNTADVPLSSFPFHLYWNAFRNTRSTLARGETRQRAPLAGRRSGDPAFGYVHVRSVRLLGEREADLTPTLRHLQPDDGNPDDRTLIEVSTPAPVAPGATARFAIEWTSLVPQGAVGRAGWVHDYHFVAQWFPKIAVHWQGRWNAHQFHATSEFFSDYGSYDVSLTVPDGFVVGATGALQGEPGRNPDGTRTHRFVEHDVHDFAWVAGRRLVERRGSFAYPGYPSVEIRLLVQPERAHLSPRYVEATRIALRAYGTWSAPYPYGHVTVVDPAWGSASGGMEYPTLFTGGTNLWAPRRLQSPETVTIHECGHQFWYLLVGTNEFEEAWLDEGLNSYHEDKAAYAAFGPRGWGRRYFGPAVSRRGSRTGWPVVAPGVWIGRGDADIPDLRRTGRADVMARRAWEYRTTASYGLNAYGKPALSLLTLERLLGEEAMTRVLRTYARRFRFGHPTAEDFIATVNEVTGRDYRWFFDQTWFSSGLCDYSVEVRNEPSPPLAGFVEGPEGEPVRAPQGPETGAARRPYDSEVTVRRLGEVVLPVEVLVEFTDGTLATERWDGRYRWTRFRYHGPARVRRAVVDPERKLALDVDPANNAWVEETGVARRAATKWSGRWMFWLQNLLELHAVLG